MALTEEELFEMSDEELAQLAKSEETTGDEQVMDNDAQVVDDNEEELLVDGEEYDDTEQPDEDSAESETDEEDGEDPNDDEVEEDEDDEEEPSEEEEEEDDNSDESDESTEDKSDDSTEKEEQKTYKFKANGQEFEFTQDEIIQQFGKVFGQAMNYTKKMQAIAPYRKMISAIEEEGLTQDDVNLMIDALKGNKDAVAEVIKRANVDVLDLDTEEERNYVPNSYGRDESELRLKEVIDEISNDKEFAITQHVVANQWDDRSKEVFAQNPELIKELHIDVVNGTFDKVSPMAMKLKVLDGGRKSDLEYYIEAGKQYHMQSRAAELEQLQAEEQQKKLAEVQAKQVQRQKTKAAAPKRKAATLPRKRTSSPKVTDYLDDSDEAFEEWYRQLQERI